MGRPGERSARRASRGSASKEGRRDALAGPGSPGVPVMAPGMPRVVIEMPAPRANGASSQAEGALESLSPEAINAWRRAIQRQAEREADVRARATIGPPPDAPRPPIRPSCRRRWRQLRRAIQPVRAAHRRIGRTAGGAWSAGTRSGPIACSPSRAARRSSSR